MPLVELIDDAVLRTIGGGMSVSRIQQAFLHVTKPGKPESRDLRKTADSVRLNTAAHAIKGRS